MRFENLAEAIFNNNISEVVRLTKLGNKLTIENLKSAFRFLTPPIALPILAIIKKHNLLPPEINFVTFKFLLFLHGHPEISANEFYACKEINIVGCPGLPSPMLLACRQGLFPFIKLLIQAGVQERPLQELFNIATANAFILKKPIDIIAYKKQSINYFKKNNLQANLSARCQILELFLTVPTKELHMEIQRLKQDSLRKDFYFLPFITWLVMHDRVEMLKFRIFNSILYTNPKLLEMSHAIASMYNAKKFLQTLKLVQLSHDPYVSHYQPSKHFPFWHFKQPSLNSLSNSKKLPEKSSKYKLYKK